MLEQDRNDLAALVVGLEDNLAELSRERGMQQQHSSEQPFDGGTIISIGNSSSSSSSNCSSRADSTGSSSKEIRGGAVNEEKKSTDEDEHYLVKLETEVKNLRKQQENLIAENTTYCQLIAEHEETMNAQRSEIIELRYRIAGIEGSQTHKDRNVNYLENDEKTGKRLDRGGWKVATEAKPESIPLPEWRGGRVQALSKETTPTRKTLESRTASPLKAWRAGESITSMSSGIGKDESGGPGRMPHGPPPFQVKGLSSKLSQRSR